MDYQQYIWGAVLIFFIILMSLQYTLNKIFVTLKDILRAIELLNTRIK